VRFVRNALRFGFSVKQIAAFLGARDAGTPPCLNVLAAAEQLRSAMDRQIEDLTAARAAIERTLREWDKRLASTPRGKPARLLETLPDAHGGRHRVRPRPA
jgi:DNA-binding transcriptional MerR regulator